MGMNIALTGLVVFLFALFVSLLAKSPPRHDALFTVCAVMGMSAIVLIPVGLIMAIWQ